MSDPIRTCGPCSVCCVVLGVPELAKGAYDACAHLCEAGCGIYADRPASCRRFECQWLRGVLESDGSIDLSLRPDACGVMFDYQPDSAFGEMFMAWEVEAGAADRRPASDILEGLAERFLVMVITPVPDASGSDERARRSFVGPPHLVRQASDVMWSRGADRGDRS